MERKRGRAKKSDSVTCRICDKQQVHPPSEGFQMGKRISEKSWNLSFPRYQIPVTNCKSMSYGNFHKNSVTNLCQKNSSSGTPKMSPGKEAPQDSPSKKMSQSIRALYGYIPAKLSTGKRWFIEFYCLDPETQKLKRKRISVPPVKGVTLRRRYANDMIARINEQLTKGWNPFLALNNPNEYTLFSDVCEQYFRYLYKLTESDIMRPKTYNGYMSYMNVFRRWNEKRRSPVNYIYQMKGTVLNEFLNWLWMDQNKSARTRDNYLLFFRSFSSWLMEQSYTSEDFTANLSAVQGKRKCAKNRTVIPKDVMERIKEYCMRTNPHFLLACYMLYYCFIRPKEMSCLKVGDVSVKSGIIAISGKFSKNRKDAVVTVPDVVMKLMIDLKTLEQPSEWYIFSKDFRPGPDFRQAKHFGDFWTLKMKKALNLPPQFKFYSLKDTGITDLIKDHTDLLAVRDQARHHSLQMTDLYTPLESREANEYIRHRESYF